MAPVLPTAPFGARAQFPPAPRQVTRFSSPLRATIANAHTVVVKVGSSSLTDDHHLVDVHKINTIVDAVTARMRTSNVVVVSSGAIAAGMAPLGLRSRPTDLPTRQAAAAVGQVHLAYEWGASFGRYSRTIGQVLLTASDAGQRDRARNIQATISRLFALHCVPVVNENDTVATAEARFGDNDRLAAVVANLIAADALILLSDVDGLYDKNPAEPGAQFVPEVREPGDLDGVVAGGGGKVGTGGMASKVSAANLATRAGIPVLLTAADLIGVALSDASVGTVFAPREKDLNAWKFWALYAADISGVLTIDAGAVKAVTRGGTSLLAVGITDVDGDFSPGSIVEIHGPDGQIIGRGEVHYDSAQLTAMVGKHTHELPEELRRPVVHADYLSNFASRA